MNSAKTTEAFLVAISSRLSGRKDCRNVNYLVSILESGHVSIDPSILIFPDKKHRHERDRVDVIAHILKTKFEYLIKDADLVRVDTDKIVNGKYRYISSVNQKRRKWTREE